jgi:hypothetical protein
MVTCTTPWLRGASLWNTSLARSMIIPSAYGPRSLTVQEAVAPEELLIVTTVPIGKVLWAQVPDGAASYHVAPPLWLRPDGAGAVEPDPVVGVGFAGAVVGFGVVLTVVVVRRTIVVDGVVLTVVWTRATVVGGSVIATVVGGSVGTGASERLTRLSTGRGSGADAASCTSSRKTCDGAEAGGGDACIRASAGPPAMAAQRATGTARRAFLEPRVVRTPPLLQNAGAARPPLQING